MIYIVTNRQELYNAVMVVSHIFKCSHTSCGRTAKRNARVGGSSSSQHMIGAAWDLVPDDYDANANAVVNIFKTMGCFALNEGDHVHVQLARRFLNAAEWAR